MAVKQLLVVAARYTVLVGAGGEIASWVRSCCFRIQQHAAAVRYSSSWWSRSVLL